MPPPEAHCDLIALRHLTGVQVRLAQRQHLLLAGPSVRGRLKVEGRQLGRCGSICRCGLTEPAQSREGPQPLRAGRAQAGEREQLLSQHGDEDVHRCRTLAAIQDLAERATSPPPAASQLAQRSFPVGKDCCIMQALHSRLWGALRAHIQD